MMYCEAEINVFKKKKNQGAGLNHLQITLKWVLTNPVPPDVTTGDLDQGPTFTGYARYFRYEYKQGCIGVQLIADEALGLLDHK